MPKRTAYTGLFKIANKLSLGKCECGKDIIVDVELAGEESESASMPGEGVEKEAGMDQESEWGEEPDDSWEESEAPFFNESDEEYLNESDDDSEDIHREASVKKDLTAFVKKASSLVEQLDTVADQVETDNPRLAARIDAVSNEIEKRVARLLQRRQNTK